MKRNSLISLFLLLLTTAFGAFAQTPEMGPHPVPEPVEPSLFNIILYIVIPVSLGIFYIYYRKKKRGKKD